MIMSIAALGFVTIPDDPSRMSVMVNVKLPTVFSGADALSTYTFGTHAAKHQFCSRCGICAFQPSGGVEHEVGARHQSGKKGVGAFLR